MSKSLPGFMPITDLAFVPDAPHPAGAPCITIDTRVNGAVRQRQSTRDLVYTPKTMLRFVHATFPDAALSKGTVVLTGTPGGVAIATPRWLVRLSDLMGLDRFAKLSAKLRDRTAFLKTGDVVTVRGAGLGEVTISVTSGMSSARTAR